MLQVEGRRVAAHEADEVERECAEEDDRLFGRHRQADRTGTHDKNVAIQSDILLSLKLQRECHKTTREF